MVSVTVYGGSEVYTWVWGQETGLSGFEFAPCDQMVEEIHLLIGKVSY